MSWAMVGIGMAQGAMNLWSNAQQGKQLGKMAMMRRKFAEESASRIWQAGIDHAAMIEGFGRWQSAMEWMTGEYQADMTMFRAEYNLQMSQYTSEYNAQLYEQEAQDIWGQMDLDIHWLQMARAAERGEIVTSYAGAGVELNSMDTPGQTLLDSKTMEELDITVIRHNAETKAGKALDSAALSRWEGRTTRQQLLYEASIESTTTLMNSFNRATSIAMQSLMDGQMTRFNAANHADSLLYEAYYDAYTYELQRDYHLKGPMHFISGFIGGGGAQGIGGLLGSS